VGKWRHRGGLKDLGNSCRDMLARKNHLQDLPKLNIEARMFPGQCPQTGLESILSNILTTFGLNAVLGDWVSIGVIGAIYARDTEA